MVNLVKLRFLNSYSGTALSLQKSGAWQFQKNILQLHFDGLIGFGPSPLFCENTSYLSIIERLKVSMLKTLLSISNSGIKGPILTNKPSSLPRSQKCPRVLQSG